MATHFSNEALKFLRALKRNNDRDWFAAHTPTYERELKEPMLAIIREVNDAMLEFAPDNVRAPQKTILRIYRDIRFSKDKRPYKIHQAAWWARHGLEKTSGGGFYFDVSGTGVTLAAGVFMPQREQLLAIRRHLVEHHAELRRLLAAKKLAKLMQPIDGLRLTRPPKGFSADDPAIQPAMDLLLAKQWGVETTLPADFATRPTLVRDIVEHFRVAAPIVALLNAPLAPKPRRPLF
jgi:uncharacterized protein (TIGR02453 family)